LGELSGNGFMDKTQDLQTGISSFWMVIGLLSAK
jgi:hypothetical protein